MSSEKYPRSSIEDDFNYGTNVATASVQIRMGEYSSVVLASGCLQRPQLTLANSNKQ